MIHLPFPVRKLSMVLDLYFHIPFIDYFTSVLSYCRAWINCLDSETICRLQSACFLVHQYAHQTWLHIYASGFTEVFLSLISCFLLYEVHVLIIDTAASEQTGPLWTSNIYIITCIYGLLNEPIRIQPGSKLRFVEMFFCQTIVGFNRNFLQRRNDWYNASTHDI